jgi:hypothetical protein
MERTIRTKNITKTIDQVTGKETVTSTTDCKKVWVVNGVEYTSKLAYNVWKLEQETIAMKADKVQKDKATQTGCLTIGVLLTIAISILMYIF